MINTKISKYIYSVAQRANLKIYPLIADSGATAPYLVYQRNEVGNENKDVLSVANFSVKCISQNYANSLELVDQFQNNLFTGECGEFEIDSYYIEDGGEDWNEGYFIQTINITVYYE